MAGGRLIWPLIEPVLDTNGQPVQGAILRVYENRTTDHATIYADEALSTPIANPQAGAYASNAAGRFFAQTKVIWASTDELYSLRVERPDGSFDQVDDIALVGTAANVLQSDLSNVDATDAQLAAFRAAVKAGAYYEDAAAIQTVDHTVGDKFACGLYGGTFWEVKSQVIIQNHFGGEPLDSSKITADDEMHLIVDLIGGGTGVAELQLGSVHGYVVQKITDLYAAHFVRSERKTVVSNVAAVHVIGDSNVYGQINPALSGGAQIATGFGDGSKHAWTQAADPWPSLLLSYLAAAEGSGKYSVLNLGYSGDRTGQMYVRHRTSAGATFTILAPGTNDTLFGSQSGLAPEDLFDTTPDPATDYRFELFTPAVRKLAYMTALKGSLPLLLAPNVWKSAIGYDGTVWSAAKISGMFRAAMKAVADEIGCGFLDLSECLKGYDNAYLTHDGVHYSAAGRAIVAARVAPMLLGKGWKYPTIIYGRTKLMASAMFDSLEGAATGGGGAGDLAIVDVLNSGLSAPLLDATHAPAMNIDATRRYFVVYCAVDEMAVVPICTAANTAAVNWDLDFGVAQPKGKLNTLPGAALADIVTYAAFQEVTNSSGSTKVYNHPSTIGAALRIQGRGWHLIGVASTTAAATLYGMFFDAFGEMGVAIANPTGGATVDAEARAAITAVLDRLRAQNLLLT